MIGGRTHCQATRCSTSYTPLHSTTLISTELNYFRGSSSVIADNGGVTAVVKPLNQQLLTLLMAYMQHPVICIFIDWCIANSRGEWGATDRGCQKRNKLLISKTLLS